MKPNCTLKWLAVAALSIRSLFWIVVAAFALCAAKTTADWSHAS